MKAIIRLTVAAIAVAALAAAALPTIQAQAKSLAQVVHETHVTRAVGSQTYADWQGALTQSFGARFLALGAKPEAIHMFEGMKKI